MHSGKYPKYGKPARLTILLRCAQVTSCAQCGNMVDRTGFPYFGYFPECIMGHAKVVHYPARFPTDVLCPGRKLVMSLKSSLLPMVRKPKASHIKRSDSVGINTEGLSYAWL